MNRMQYFLAGGKVYGREGERARSGEFTPQSNTG